MIYLTHRVYLDAPPRDEPITTNYIVQYDLISFLLMDVALWQGESKVFLDTYKIYFHMFGWRELKLIIFRFNSNLKLELVDFDSKHNLYS